MRTLTSLPDTLPYPAAYRAKLSTAHSAIISCAAAHWTNTFKERQHLTQVLNTVSYKMLSGEPLPSEWEAAPLALEISPEVVANVPDIIKDIYVDERKVQWDIEPSVVTTSTVNLPSQKVVVTPVNLPVQPHPLEVMDPTPKEDLYIRPPTVPRFNPDKVWASGTVDGNLYVIYESEPTIPTKQNEISVTTDVTRMTAAELRRLYPNTFIRTRSPSMYEPVPGLTLHPQLGLIFPINGFTSAQIIDNIIKYPHIFRLMKHIDGQVSSFYTTIELDGELYKVAEVWNTLPEASKIPYTADFIKEYVVRRYLLERDIYGVDHRYKMYGSLDPFLTLFTTPDDYIRLGYTDIEGMARKCVTARVNFKQTRNPVLRRLNNV